MVTGGAPWASRARLALVCAVTAVLAAASFLMTASMVLTRTRPDLAARLWPADSEAQSALAGTLMLTGRSGTTAATAMVAATRALAWSPGDATAAWAAGLAALARDDRARGTRWLAYSERLSRREMSAQLALIQISVDRGDVAGALTHYDRALRVGEVIPSLLQVMGAAADDPRVRRPLIGMLRTAPPWRSAFLVYLMKASRSWEAPDEIFSAIHLHPSGGQDQESLGDAIRRLVAQRHPREARSLLPDPSPALVRNGDFEAANVYPPFDWTLAQDANLNASIDRGPPGTTGDVLFLSATDGAAGEVASQMLILPPGRYQLSLVAGGVNGSEEDRPRVSLTCQEEATAVSENSLPVTARPMIVRSPSFTVPAGGCATQQLHVRLSAPTDADGGRPWIDKLVISRVPA